MKMFAAVALALLVAACAPVPPECRTTGPRDLKTIDRLIAESQTALSRGYRYEETRSTGPGFCLGGGGTNVGLSFCSNGNGRKPVAVDQAAERRKLEGLKVKRSELLRQQAARAAACGTAG